MCAEGSSSANCKPASRPENAVSYVHLKDLISLKISVCRFHIPCRLVSTLTLLSKKLNCYKVTLECSTQNMPFYQKFGYEASAETYMQRRFSDWGLDHPEPPFRRWQRTSFLRWKLKRAANMSNYHPASESVSRATSVICVLIPGWIFESFLLQAVENKYWCI